MVTEVSQHLDAIIALCKKMQVETLYLFGSAAHVEDFKKDSDIDFLLKYKKDQEGLPAAPFDYFDLLFSLEQLTGRKVDIVVEDSIKNPYFRQQIDKEKIKLYEA